MATASAEIVATLVDTAEAKQAAMEHLNQQLAKKAGRLAAIHDIVKQLQNIKVDMERKLQSVSSAAPDQISEALQSAEEALDKAKELQQQAQQIHEEHSTHSSRVSGLLEGVEQQLLLVQQLDRVHAYQGWGRSIHQISTEMCNLSSPSSECRLLTLHSQLEDNLLHLSSSDDDGRAPTGCSNLRGYVARTLQYWHTRLMHTFSQEFEAVLKSINYPFISTNTTVIQTSPPIELFSRLQTLTKYLLQLHKVPDTSTPPSSPPPPTTTNSLTTNTTAAEGLLNTSVCSESSANESFLSACSTASSSSPTKSPRKIDSPRKSDDAACGDIHQQQPAIVADFPELITPLKLLLKPLEVRFLFHFSGDKKTNSSSHPEWCLTRVLSWVNGHSSFLAKHIQPVLDDCQHSHVRAKTEFSRTLVRLVVLKLSQDLPSVLSDEDLFCHSLQETLNFERELRLSCGYPSNQPSVLVVLTQPKVLSHWLELERKFAVAVMDELVSMTGAWDCPDGGVSGCGEQLVTLLQGITDRYKPLPQPGHRLQFLEVQLEVLDEFRLRSVQVSGQLVRDPVASHYPAILNTLHHITDTLSDWEDMPFFLELQLYRSKCKMLEDAALSEVPGSNSRDTEQEELGSVFTECTALYSHVQQEMMCTLLQHVVTEVRARFMPYRRDKWFLEPPAKGTPPPVDVSPSLCPLLEVLLLQLQRLRSMLTAPLFATLWQALAKDIDRFLFEELVLQNHFSELGSGQLEHDLTRALFPVFAEYTSKPETHFVIMKECLCLLRLSRATALLLRDTLHLSLHCTSNAAAVVVDPSAALADHGVTRLSPTQAYTVLNTRTNMAGV